MARRVEDLAPDAVVVPIPGDAPQATIAEWLRSLRQDEPTELGVNAADLVAEVRRGRVTAFVLDASASVELLLDTAAGRRLQEKVRDDAPWWVPEHFYAEVARARFYGVLAEHLGADLITADLKLVRAPGLGVRTIDP